ncbi:hypothetical protein HI914_02676 [Erysiphe necator]|nr:hypothetical protein HI914_02676 [Erysiphe necator]
MAERAFRKEQKSDAEKAWKLAHRAEGVLKGHRRSDRNVGRALSSKISRNNENLKMVMKAEAHFHIPKTYEEAINSSAKNDWLKAINDEINSLKNRGTFSEEIPKPKSDCISSMFVFVGNPGKLA